MKYAILTFGCRVNQADSLGFEEDLLRRGAVPASADAADLVLVNTCSVTSTADQGARQAIRRIARTNPAARVVVTGCYATRAPEEIRDLPHVVKIVPNPEKHRLLSLLDDAGVTTAERFGDGPGGCGAAIAPGVAGRTAFTLRVQTGCAEACSYCIIPSTRGAPQSVPMHDVRAHVERALAAGFKEVAITGVHLGSYGRDLAPRESLTGLVDTLAAVGEARDVLFRISSLEPMDCTPEIVQRVAASRALAHHFHLPLQHASARMLAAMRRPYAPEEYAALVDSIRCDIPDVSIGADVIAGFPGESDADFDRLESYLSGSPLTHLHVFPYSDRPGTEASALGGKVHGSIVRERAARLRAVSSVLSSRFRDSQIGSVHRALTLEDGTTALTGNFLKLKVAPGNPRNSWVTVRVQSHHDGELLGG
jgi:threonylcarbamoyladenosine tRNA methylthiotransferase MtaB